MTSSERSDILETLAAHRGFLLHAASGITDDQARQQTTISALTLGGLVKHVSLVEQRWADFIERGADAMTMTEHSMIEHGNSFVLLPDETLAEIVAAYERVAQRTDDLVRSLPDLDVAHLLPEAPWFPPGATRSARRVFLHIVAETAQHAGHADIVREALDGQKTMG